MQLEIGEACIIESGCTLTSCTLGENVWIGPNSVIGEGCVIEDNVLLGPNSVVPPGTLVEEGEIWAGNPLKYMGKVEKRFKNVRKDKMFQMHRM